MTWVRLDDSFPEHPKVSDLSDGAFRVHIVGLCYSGRLLTNGYIPRSIARFYSGSAVKELLKAGLWKTVETAGGGYLIHDYLDWNPSREQVLHRRRAEAERKSTTRVRPDSARESAADSAQESVGPDPTRPLPVSKSALVVDDQQRFLVDRLTENVSATWMVLNDQALLELSKTIGTDAVRNALRHAWEDKIEALNPVGWIIHVAREETA